MTNNQQSMSFQERMLLTEVLLQMLAITVWVFIRRDIGYRMLNPTKLFIFAVLLIAFARVTPGSSTPLTIYAVAMFFMGLLWRRLRWRDFVRGRLLHSKHAGSSYLVGLLPLDAYKIQRFLEPILLFAIAATIWTFFNHALGFYLLFMSGVLAATEAQMHQRMIERQLDMHDAQCQAEAAAEMMTPLEIETKGWREAGRVVSSTGLTSDLQELIARRAGY